MKRVLSGAAIVMLLLTGCGNDEAQADVQRFCELVEQYNKGTGFVAPAEDLPEEERAAATMAALKDYLSLPEIQAILDELGQVAPDEVRDAVTTMRNVASDLVENDVNRFEDTEAAEANQAIVTYTTASCAPEDAGEEEAGAGAAEDEGTSEDAADADA